MNPYDYQDLAVDHAAKWLSSAQPGGKLLLAAPTGSGKSHILIRLQRRTGALIVVPRVEIAADFMRKMGCPVPGDEEELFELAAERGVTTPVRLRNRLVSGAMSPPPAFLIDEAHHDLAETYQQLYLLAGFAPTIGVTATPFRGTPRATAKFREEWGDPVWVITFGEAAQRGVVSTPECETWALVDDDLIEVRDGELVASQVEAMVSSRLQFVAANSATRFVGAECWDKPTMFALPSRALGRDLCDRMLGLACYVDGDTPYAERRMAFRALVERRVALVQVDVVSEGIDLPIARLIDLAPCLSPVRWMQRVGRITRPTVRSHYVCCNRNLLRHGYLLDGCVPNSAFKSAEALFGGPSKRGAARAVGLEAIGRLRGFEVRSTSGLTMLCYAVSSLAGYRRTDYFVLVHPNMPEPIWASKVAKRDPDTAQVIYGRWERCAPPDDLRGFNSIPPAALSEKQKAWWNRSAPNFGLDAAQEVTRKNFPILPVLADLRMRIA